MLRGVNDVMGEVLVDTKSYLVSIPGIPNVNVCVEVLKSAGYEAEPLLDDLPPKVEGLATCEERDHVVLLEVKGMTCQSVLCCFFLLNLQKLHPIGGTCSCWYHWNREDIGRLSF